VNVPASVAAHDDASLAEEVSDAVGADPAARDDTVE
jgi:hypothetical protein